MHHGRELGIIFSGVRSLSIFREEFRTTVYLKMISFIRHQVTKLFAIEQLQTQDMDTTFEKIMVWALFPGQDYYKMDKIC